MVVFGRLGLHIKKSECVFFGVNKQRDKIGFRLKEDKMRYRIEIFFSLIIFLCVLMLGCEKDLAGLPLYYTQPIIVEGQIDIDKFSGSWERIYPESHNFKTSVSFDSKRSELIINELNVTSNHRQNYTYKCLLSNIDNEYFISFKLKNKLFSNLKKRGYPEEIYVLYKLIISKTNKNVIFVKQVCITNADNFKKPISVYSSKDIVASIKKKEYATSELKYILVRID